jgi:uncharacterized membrane protein
MKTNQFILVIVFIFSISASAVYAFPESGWSPVHEQRKALYEKKKKIYGPKKAKSKEQTAADQGAADDKDQVKEKDVSKDTVKDLNKSAAESIPKSAATNATAAQSYERPIPPPSKNLLRLKKAHEPLFNKKPAAQPAYALPDVVGTVSPQVQP